MSMSNPMQLCKRCGKPYSPRWLAGLQKFSACCESCGVRNLFDALDLPTPPVMLDKFTKHPTLTEAEYHKEIDKPDIEE